ncbi:MAG TPA: RES domain-containing protein [Chloroflexota bacterium]|nr:RES domain-containing protein [Chloroflexota bacterium]
MQRFVHYLCTRDPTSWWSRHGEAMPTRFVYWGLMLLRFPVARQILAEAQRAAHRGLHGEYWRARILASSVPRPEPSEFGPPPRHKRTRGRYNEGKDLVLYLARTPETAVSECSANEDRTIFVQQFGLQLENARVLQFTADLERDFPHLHYLLLESEFLPAEAGFVPDPYRATHYVAFICRLLGIAGVEYASLKGGFKEDPDAVNLVLFGPAARAATGMTLGTAHPMNTPPH